VVFALSVDILAAAVPGTVQYGITCKNPLIRKEWRKLKTEEKQDYIHAVKCLQKLPTKSDPYQYPGARTRYDDFHSVHITKAQGLIEGTGGIHFVGFFLPWHRYFVIAYEKALREECGYKGAQPYWNWTLDATAGKDIRGSPVFDPVTGFGGNGKAGVPNPPDTLSRHSYPGGTGGGCVVNGPFQDMTLNIGPGPNVTYNPRCLTRSINPWMGNFKLDYSNIAPLDHATTFKQFDLITQGFLKSFLLATNATLTFHGGGHYVIGGEASDFMSSNAEPLFYLHHAFIDALWLKWQKSDYTGARFYDISGPQIPFTTTPQVTLDFPIDLGILGKSIPLSKVMDVRKGNPGGIGCYEYEW